MKLSSHYNSENYVEAEDESTEEWMECLYMAAAKCGYKEVDSTAQRTIHSWVEGQGYIR